MPVHFQLDTASGVPFLPADPRPGPGRDRDRALVRGERLPTVRALAVDLAVNLNTVVRAYKELEIRGVLATQQGSGTFVASEAVSIRRGGETAPAQSAPRRIPGPGGGPGLTLGEIRDALAEREAVS